MNLKFAWSTYSPDGGCCVQSVQGVLDLGANPTNCIVYYQKGKPLYKEHAAILQALGVGLQEGRYTRKDTYFDVIAKFRSVVATGGDLVWSIDSDVIVNELSPAQEVFNGGYIAGAAHWNGCNFSGCSTLIRPQAAKACVKDLLENNTPKLPGRGVPDDIMMGTTLDTLFGATSVLRWNAAILGWYEFQRNWADMVNYKWIHFGQKKLARGLARGRPVRAAIEEHMREYREWRKTTA